MPRGHPGISGTGNASISVGLDWSLVIGERPTKV